MNLKSLRLIDAQSGSHILDWGQRHPWVVTWKAVTGNTRHGGAKWQNYIPMLRRAQTVLESCQWIPWTSLPTSGLDHDSFLPLGSQIPLTFPPRSLPFLSSCLPDSESGISSPGQKLKEEKCIYRRVHERDQHSHYGYVLLQPVCVLNALTLHFPELDWWEGASLIRKVLCS